MANTANIKLLVKEVKDITECPICTELFRHPKMLPCFHTFCLNCIERYCKDKDVGDTMPCPMCRRDFAIPVGGLSKLSVNFFIDRLIAVQSASEIKEELDCDVCLRGKQSKVTASSYCMECRENMCDQCSSMHKSMKVSRRHQVLKLDESSNAVEIQEICKKNFCDKHTGEEIKFFCRDYKIKFCTTCFIGKHNKHDCCEIEDLARELKRSFKKHSDDVNILLTYFKEQSEQVTEQVKTFSTSINVAETKINERTKSIKRMVDRHSKLLLEELNSRKSHVLENVQETQDELQRNVMVCASFISYCQKAIKEADAAETIELAEELNTRVEALKRNPICKIEELQEIKFITSDLKITRTSDNIVGQIKDERSGLDAVKGKRMIPLLPHDFWQEPVSEAWSGPTPSIQQGLSRLLDQCIPRSSIQMRRKVAGMAVSNCILYIGYAKSEDEMIHVHDTTTLEFKRHFTISGLKTVHDMAATEGALYISDTSFVYKVALQRERTTNKWTVYGTILKLSVTRRDSLLISCRTPAKLFEYTSNGNLVRSIPIDKSIELLYHAIDLEEDRFLICHGGSLQRVCIIDWNGKIIKSHGREPGSSIDRLNFPVYLAVLPDGAIIVADEVNTRVIHLDASLECPRVFHPGAAGRRICQDKANNVVYISDASARLAAFQISFVDEND